MLFRVAALGAVLALAGCLGDDLHEDTCCFETGRSAVQACLDAKWSTCQDPTGYENARFVCATYAEPFDVYNTAHVPPNDAGALTCPGDPTGGPTGAQP